MRRFLVCAFLAAILGAGRPAASDDDLKRWSYNDFGGVGLFQTPTARFADDGEIALGFVYLPPNRTGFLTFQALPWLEGTFRYTRIDRNAPLGDTFERGLDAKIRLVEEGDLWPALAVGFRDFLGSGPFSGEYLVASKRFYDLDFSLGLGWGRLGSQGDFKNPLTLVSNRFESRKSGSDFHLDNFFSGQDVALFGGLEYVTPIDGLHFKLEYNGDAFLQERSEAPDFKNLSRWNIGFDYRPFSWLDLSLAHERGDAWMARATLGFNAKSIKAPADRRDGPMRPLPRAEAARRLAIAEGGPPDGRAEPDRMPSIPLAPAPRRRDRDVATFYAALETAGFEVSEIDYAGEALTIALDPPVAPGGLERARTIARRAARYLPIPISAVDVRVAPPDASRDGRGPEARTAVTASTRPVPAPRQPKPVPAAFAPPRQVKTAEQAARDILEKDLPEHGFDFYGIELDKRTATVFLANRRYREPALGLGRAAQVIADALPASIEVIRIVERRHGIETARVSILRKDLENAHSFRGSPEEIWQHTVVASTTGEVPRSTAHATDAYPRFDWSIDPALSQSLFDPGVPYLYQLSAQLGGAAELAPGLEASGTLRHIVADNLDRLNLSPGGGLPHVRSDVRRYVDDGRTGIAKLQLNYMWNAAPDLYARMTAGLLEPMFGGVSGELLYRPERRRWAVGLDLNQVWQRGYDELLDFRGYDVLTGHLNAYLDLPHHDYRLGLSLGRYLAGDWGGTIRLTRRFESGIVFGGYVTLTDAPFDPSGQGRFDKGIVLEIPLDLLLGRHTRRRVDLPIRAFGRDSGQQLDVSPRLYDVTDPDSFGAIRRSWRHVAD